MSQIHKKSLGSAHGGTSHWWSQRISSLGLIVLGVWFLISLKGQPLHTVADIHAWLKASYRPVLMILLIITALYHAYLGIQVIVGDYVHTTLRRTVLLMTLKSLCLTAAVAGVFSVLHLTKVVS